MRLVVNVEIHAMNAATRFTVAEHPFRTVAERQNRYALAADRSFSRQLIHLGIRDAFGCGIASHPRVEDARTVDAQQHAEACLVFGIVYVCESVHARQRVVVYCTVHSIDHARCPRSRSNLTRIEHIERQGVVGLVARTISNRRTCFQPEFGGSCCTYLILSAKIRHHIGKQGVVETKIIEQEIGDIMCFEIPKHTFRKPFNRCVYRTAQPHGNVVAR